LHRHRSGAPVEAELPLVAVAEEPEPSPSRSLSDALGGALGEPTVRADAYETPDQKRRKVVGQARSRGPPPGAPSTKADVPAQ